MFSGLFLFFCVMTNGFFDLSEWCDRRGGEEGGSGVIGGEGRREGVV